MTTTGEAGSLNTEQFNRHLQQLEDEDDVPGLIRRFDRIIAEYGGKGFVAAAWDPHEPAHILLYASQIEPFSGLDAESAWWADDPIVARLAQGMIKPFSYEDAWQDPLPTAAERWPALVAAGLDRGIVFPTSRPPHIGSVLVFGSSEPGAMGKMVSAQSLLHLLATYFHAMIVEQVPGDDTDGVIRNTLFTEVIAGRRAKLSTREIDCLRWLALGKSARDIAEIEKLSVHTVRSYLRNAMQKLGATTQSHAVALAVKYRIIKP